VAHKLHLRLTFQHEEIEMATARKRAFRKPPSLRQVRLTAGIKEPKSAIVLLKADHREVEGYFKAFKRSDSAAEKRTLAEKICHALKTHTRIEEEIFYPAFIEATGDTAMHDEALIEHDGAKKLIAEIETGSQADSMFDARVTVLSEMIKHHVKEEEGFGGMFAKARRSKMDLLAVGTLLEARKQELMTERRQAKKTFEQSAPFLGAAARSRLKGPRPKARRGS
jgi:hemerythrin superfamily protein